VRKKYIKFYNKKITKKTFYSHWIFISILKKKICILNTYIIIHKIIVNIFIKSPNIILKPWHNQIII
jgi:hypothetical protein